MSHKFCGGNCLVCPFSGWCHFTRFQHDAYHHGRSLGKDVNKFVCGCAHQRALRMPYVCTRMQWLRQFVFVTNYTCDLLAVSVASKKGGEKPLGNSLVCFPPLQKSDKKRKIPQTFFFICCFVVKSTFISFDPCPILLSKPTLGVRFTWGETAGLKSNVQTNYIEVQNPFIRNILKAILWTNHFVRG